MRKSVTTKNAITRSGDDESALRIFRVSRDLTERSRLTLSLHVYHVNAIERTVPDSRHPSLFLLITIAFDTTSRRRRFALTTAGMFLMASGVHAQSIGFDDLPCGNIGAAVQVPAGYFGLTWDGFRCYDVTTAGNPPSFLAARTSGNNVAWNRAGGSATITSATAFSLLNARVTLSDPNLVVAWQFDGWSGATKLFSKLIDSPADKSFQTFDFVGIDRVTMSRTKGSGLFLFDDINVSVQSNVVPEPATTALLAGGVLALGVIVRRRQRLS